MLSDNMLFAVMGGFFIGSALFRAMEVLLFSFIDPLVFGWWSDNNLQDQTFGVGNNSVPWGATLMVVLQVGFVALIVYGLGRWFGAISKKK